MDELDADLVRDHVGGLELRLVELVELQKRALVQGQRQDAERLQVEIDALHAQLAQVADLIPPDVDPEEGAAT